MLSEMFEYFLILFLTSISINILILSRVINISGTLLLILPLLLLHNFNDYWNTEIIF